MVYTETPNHHTLRPFVVPVSLLLSGLLLASCGSAKLERELRSDIADVRTLQAEQTAQLSQIRTEIRTLTGRVDELEYSAVGKTKEFEQQLQRLGSRVPPPPGVPEKLLVQDEEQIASNTGPAAEAFKQGLRALRVGQFEQAQQVFRQFEQENPGTAFTDNALFWIGICFEKLGQYDSAIVAYSDVFEKYPAEDRVPAALYYLGEAFQKIGSGSDAKLSFQKLVDEHPSSSFAAKARQRIAQLRKKRGKRRR